MNRAVQPSAVPHPVLRLTTPAGTSWSISAVHYEIVHIAASADPLERPFPDVHILSDGSVSRFVAGYLGIEARGGEHLVITSHGRDVALVRADEHGNVALTPAGGGSSWPDQGIALVPVGAPSPNGQRGPGVTEKPRRSEVYIVHGPAAEKVVARRGQLHARARLFGHPRPATVDP